MPERPLRPRGLRLPPVKIRARAIGTCCVVIRNVNRPQLRVIHLLGEQVELRVSIAEKHVVTALAADVVPCGTPIVYQPVAVAAETAATVPATVKVDRSKRERCLGFMRGMG